MNTLLYRAAAGVGLLATGWVGAGYLRNNPLALAMTLLIGAFYVMGALELQRYRQATAALAGALDALATAPAQLADWLAQVPPPLRNAVRQRVEGESGGLPGPALAPYLAGLLVLLGMLGTFVGMVVTLNGTGLALANATDVQTMRDSLSAPVKGLGLAFGTSVAGVAASAMLGLMTALSRLERQQAAQRLEGHVATTLRPFTRAWQQAQQREAAFALQQQQAALLPALVNQLQALMAQLAQQAQQSNDHLLAGQQRFHTQAETSYRTLATTVGQTLQRSLDEAARTAAATLQPAVQDTLRGITQETAALHGHIASAVQQQLEGFAQRFEARSAQWLQEAGTQARAHDQQRQADWAQMAAGLREQLSASLLHDQAALEERSQLMATLHTLLGALQQTAGEQQAAVQQLVAATAAGLEQAGARFTEQMNTEAARLDAVAAQVTGSAVEVASLGEAFGTAVNLFHQGSQQLVAQLQQVETALGKSTARSDEQLAYYVAQAREVIDLSLLSQKQIVDELQRLAARQAAEV